MVGRLYHLGRAESRERARELLERFDLAEAGDRPAKTYSGGMRRRLDLAGALVAQPPVLFLDEPTTGLDPRSRLGMWDVIGDLVRGGTTLLLTTQYLEEADQLADHIAVIDHGKVIARGHRRRAQGPGRRRAARAHRRRAAHVEDARRALASVGKGEAKTDRDGRRLTVPVAGGSAVLVAAIRELDAAGVVVSRHRAAAPDPRRRVPQPHRHAAEEATPTATPPMPTPTPRRRPRRRRWRRDECPDRGGLRLPPSSPSATSSRSSGSPTCWSSRRCRRSCSCCCSPTCSAARSTCRASATGSS